MKPLPLVWLHNNPEFIGTILSFRIEAYIPGVRVVDTIHVMLLNTSVLSFWSYQDGLYYLDSTKLNIHQIINYPNNTLLSTLDKNKSFLHTKRNPRRKQCQSNARRISLAKGIETLKAYYIQES